MGFEAPDLRRNMFRIQAGERRGITADQHGLRLIGGHRVRTLGQQIERRFGTEVALQIFQRLREFFEIPALFVANEGVPILAQTDMQTPRLGIV